jgi:transposase
LKTPPIELERLNGKCVRPRKKVSEENSARQIVAGLGSREHVHIRKERQRVACIWQMRTDALMLSQPDNLPSVIRRRAAGQLLLDGASVEEVAGRFHISLKTVKRYQALVESGGLDALRQFSVGGRSSALDDDALIWISKALQGSAKVHGFESDVWTNSRLRGLIDTTYGVRFSRVYIWQIATNLGLGHVLSKSQR